VVFVLLLVNGTAWSIKADEIRRVKVRAALREEERQTLLLWHRNTMLAIVLVSGATAALMLYKKWAGGLGILLISGRMPSYHSWTTMLWGALELLMVVSGLLIFIGTGYEPPSVLVTPAKAAFSSLGQARTVLRPLHANIGMVALTVGLGAAAAGLTEKNDDASKQRLAALLVVIWLLVVLAKLL